MDEPKSKHHPKTLKEVFFGRMVKSDLSHQEVEEDPGLLAVGGVLAHVLAHIFWLPWASLWKLIYSPSVKAQNIAGLLVAGVIALCLIHPDLEREQGPIAMFLAGWFLLCLLTGFLYAVFSGLYKLLMLSVFLLLLAGYITLAVMFFWPVMVAAAFVSLLIEGWGAGY